MPITASDLKVEFRGTVLGEQWMNVQWYRLVGAAFLTATALGVAEALWNDVKTDYRNMAFVSSAVRFLSVFVSEPGSTGAYAEYAVPTAEQTGTRSLGSGSSMLPSANAMGVRLTVGSRTTRPGQKRFSFIYEEDNDNGVAGANIVTLTEALALKFSSPITLGVPVATGVMHPEVCRVNRISGVVEAKQDIDGFVVNPLISTQNSRKPGRGS